MTTVTIDLRAPSLEPDAGPGAGRLATGELVWTPTRRRVVTGDDGPHVTLPAGVRTLLRGAVVTVGVDATGADWCWQVTERVAGGRTRYLAVPESTTPVPYSDLVEVDPATLDPSAEPEAAWWAVAGGGTRNLSRYLQAGESLPNDGVVDASPLLQRALDAAALDVSTSGPVQLVVPEGRYRMTTALAARTGVGIVGAGRDLTVFLPQGDQPFMVGPIVSAEPPEGWDFIDDLLMSDFTIDCTGQVWTSYVFGIKAFYMQNIRRGRFHRLALRGSWASMYGMDFLIDTEFVDCVGEDSGRGGPPSHTSTGSTFAFGVGRFPDESIRLVNCVARNAAAAGYYFERLESRGAFLKPNGFTLTGCIATGCGLGVNDAGTGGVTSIGGDFSNNLHEGWLAASGGQASTGGINGAIIATNIANNPDGGIVFAGNGAGGYSIGGGSLVVGNGGGIVVRAGASIDPAGIRIQGATIRDNEIGVHVEPGVSGRLAALTIDSNAFDSNARAHVLIESGALGPQVTGNAFTGDATASVELGTGLSITAPAIERNRWYDQTAPLVGTGGYDQTRIRDNLTLLTFTAALRAAAGGVDPLVSQLGAGTFAPAVSMAQPLTMYVVATGAPAASAAVSLRTAAGVARLSAQRNSGGTAWVAFGYSSTGSSHFASSTGPSAPGVIAVVRDASGVRVHPRGLTQAVTAIASYPVDTVDRVVAAAGYGRVLLYAGTHDDATRVAVMDVLAAEYGIP